MLLYALQQKQLKPDSESTIDGLGNSDTKSGMNSFCYIFHCSLQHSSWQLIIKNQGPRGQAGRGRMFRQFCRPPGRTNGSTRI